MGYHVMNTFRTSHERVVSELMYVHQGPLKKIYFMGYYVMNTFRTSHERVESELY